MFSTQDHADVPLASLAEGRSFASFAFPPTFRLLSKQCQRRLWFRNVWKGFVAFTGFLIRRISSCCYIPRNRGSPEPPGSSPLAASTPQSPGSEERTVLNTTAVGILTVNICQLCHEAG